MAEASLLRMSCVQRFLFKLSGFEPFVWRDNKMVPYRPLIIYSFILILATFAIAFQRTRILIRRIVFLENFNDFMYDLYILLSVLAICVSMIESFAKRQHQIYYYQILAETNFQHPMFNAKVMQTI